VDAVVGRNGGRMREEVGATQDDLAEALKKSGWQASVLTVLALERGERIVNLEEALLLGDVLNVPVAELLAGEHAQFVQLGGVLYPENTQELQSRLTKANRRKSTTWSDTQRRRQHVQIDTGGY